MQQICRRYSGSTFIIHIDAIDQGEFSGQFCFPDQDKVYRFESLMQLLLQMEKCLDASNEPQAFAAMRSFWTKGREEENEKENVFGRTGKLASFSIQIMFRRNASWQGMITWLEEGEKRNFRSVLELLFLINNALSAKESFVFSGIHCKEL